MSILFLLLVAMGAIWEGRRLLNDPNVIFLMPEDGAQWIQLQHPFLLFTWLEQTQSLGFRTQFEIPVGFKGAEIKVRALREVKVFVDRRRVFQSEPGGNWKEEHQVEIPATLGAGRHVLDVVVRNVRGPAMALVNGPQLNLRSNESWEVSGDGRNWKRASVADAPNDPELEYLFGPCSSDVAALSPLLVILFALGMGGTLVFYGNGGKRDWVRFLRWFLLGAWIFFGINSYFKIPSDVGYDVEAHVKYVHFILDHGRAPLPDEGTEFFQAPFFYLVSAGFYRLIELAGVSGEAADQMLRVVPLLCAIGIVEICYRAARLLFGERKDLQAVVVAIGALMPMNLYMAPAVSNEPMVGLWGSLIVLFSFYFLLNPGKITTLKWQIAYGGLLGLGLLTKVTALVWIVPILFVLVVCFRRVRLGILRRARGAVVVVTVSLMICSWFFVRNWMERGSEFLPEVQTGSHIIVQDPGFRTPHRFLEFGRVFARPVYSGLNSLWDTLYGTMWVDGFMSGLALYHYRPPWNFRLMSCGLWLSVFPMLAITAGVGRCIVLTIRDAFGTPPAEFSSNDSRQLVFQFALLSIGCFVGAIAFEYLKNPIYGAGKATYMMGLIPCFAVLGAAGFDLLPNRKMVRALAAGLLTCWGVIAFLTYWIV